MREWTDPYNPFNSFKALVWREWFEGFAEGNFLPPVCTDTDPAWACNFRCLRCNARRCTDCNVIMVEDHLLRLADFYAEWGVKSTCVAGGGEPLLASGLPAFLRRLKANGVESGVITNGSLMYGLAAEAMAECCRWIGVSVDAARPVTFAMLHRTQPGMCETVHDNLRQLCSAVRAGDSDCVVAYKFLLQPENAAEIVEAAMRARDAGCHHFHCRPVGWDNLYKIGPDAKPDWKPVLDIIEKQLDELHTLETADFKVFGIRHKFQPDLTRQVRFKRCRAAPLLLTFGADGNCHLCFDLRGDLDLILCRHEPDPSEVLKHWNTDRHRAMLHAINPENCPRCTFGPYNEMVKQVFVEDRMCRFFP